MSEKAVAVKTTIPIDGTLYQVCRIDPLNWALQERKQTKPKPDRATSERWVTLSYHLNFLQALEAAARLLTDESEIRTIQEYVATIKETVARLERVTVNG